MTQKILKKQTLNISLDKLYLFLGLIKLQGKILNNQNLPKKFFLRKDGHKNILVENILLVSMSALAGMSVNPVNGLSSLQSTIQSMSMQSMASPMHSLALPTSSPPYISQVGGHVEGH